MIVNLQCKFKVVMTKPYLWKLNVYIPIVIINHCDIYFQGCTQIYTSSYHFASWIWVFSSFTIPYSITGVLLKDVIEEQSLMSIICVIGQRTWHSVYTCYHTVYLVRIRSTTTGYLWLLTKSVIPHFTKIGKYGYIMTEIYQTIYWTTIKTTATSHFVMDGNYRDMETCQKSLKCTGDSRLWRIHQSISFDHVILIRKFWNEKKML